MQNKTMQLFILPYAGGSAAAFRRLTNLIDEHIEAITVEYAGRGTRSREAPAKSLDALIADAVSFCEERRDENIPYAVMGYSMGSVLAYEILAGKAIRGELRHLFIAAEVSPGYRSLELQKMSNPTEEQIMERVRQLGGLDERLLQNKRFADIFIRPMLSDYRLFFSYRFGGCTEKINADTTFFYCEKDTALCDVEKWTELIAGHYSYYEMGENHFFINQHYGEIARVINETLA